jgi:hypothetical protein
MYVSANDTDLLFALRSLKDRLNSFVSHPFLQAACQKDDRLSDIVEKAKSLRNLIETTRREINPNWRED